MKYKTDLVTSLNDFLEDELIGRRDDDGWVMLTHDEVEELIAFGLDLAAFYKKEKP